MLNYKALESQYEYTHMGDNFGVQQKWNFNKVLALKYNTSQNYISCIVYYLSLINSSPKYLCLYLLIQNNF